MPATAIMSRKDIFSKANMSTSVLSFSRTYLQQVARENVDIADCGKYTNEKGETVNTRDALNSAIENSKHYHFSEVLEPPSNNPGHKMRIYVTLGLCIKAALQLKKHYGRHVGVLNSSHATTPGGKFKTGCLSLEACICRGSLLWPCLTQFADKKNTLYTINREEKYKLNPSTCAIFSPNVPVIRKDSFEAQFLDMYQVCSFVSLPPPNAFELGSDDAVKKALRERIYRSLCIFALQGCTDLVLCSYGCGTRGNDAKMVAEVYNDLLSNEMKGHFDTIIFAINPRKDSEYDDFTSVFEQP